MSGDDISRRRLLLGLGSAGAVGFASGTGTRAALFDRETVADNRLRAGNVDLELATTWLRRRPDEEWTAWDDRTESWTPYDGSGFDGVSYATESRVRPVVDEVREGHEGYVWTAFRVCDNPATVEVRLDGTADGDDDGEDLVDRVEGTLYYADSLDALTDPTGATTLATGSLRDLLGGSYHLGPGATGGTTGGTTDDPIALGKLEFDENEGGVLDISLEGTSQSWSGTYDAGVEEFAPADPPTFEFDGPDGAVTVELTRFYVKDADGDDREVYAFDFETTAGSVCRVEVKGGTGTNVSGTDELGPNGGTALRPPENNGGKQAAISNVVFSTCPGSGDDPEPPGCLPACEPAYLGLAWTFPDEGGPDDGWLGDRVDFTLTFDAVQCRHHDGAGGEGGRSA
ncbi:hypothetical protein ACFO0N_07945 [Halobium salinum]|uniref:SipW-cognate class signal peptide n=1 Tax=Halobium salinum TaxID=1364940 RepID=A0ABD5PAG1_9EURY|nr:hypothetical protein [Halobium salinum]